MNNETYRKIVVAGCMTAALAIGIAVFAFRHPAALAVAHQPAPPPTTGQAPPPPPQVAQSGEGTAQPAPADSIASQEQAPAPLVAKSKPTPTQAPNRPVTLSHAAAEVGTKGSAAAASPDSTSTAMVPPATSERNDSEASGAPATGDSPPDAPKPSGGADYAAADQQITIDVKSEISRDGSNKGAVIEVTTDHGVVALSGSVPDQNTFEHVKEVVARVRGVTGVDTTALSVASLMSSAIQQ